MIIAQFKLASELIEVIVRGNELLFRDIGTGTITSIAGLKFSKAGVLKEHPDLKDEIEWKKIAIERLKKYLKKLKTEKEKMYYVKDELIKFGYDPLHWQRAGHRPKKFEEKI